MSAVTNAPTTTESFVHPALFYRGREEYLAGMIPFIRDGLAMGEPVAVAVPGPNLALLRAELGAAADGVRFLDMTRAGRNPGRIIPGVLRAFADAHPNDHVRIIGEPIWPGRSALEYPACVQHEALINFAFAGRMVTILCPYDADGLDPAVLEDAAATHPVLIDRGGQLGSTAYAPERVVADYNQPLPVPPGTAASVTFDGASLAQVRRFAVEQARLLGLLGNRLDDLELMVSELATNSVVYGGGIGTLLVWSEDGTIACEVRDDGHITDMLAGRRPAPLRKTGGRGLLLVNYLADLIRIHTGADGTTIRLHVAL